jgi:hypothetical protein
VKVAADHIVAIQRPLVVPVVSPEWVLPLTDELYSDPLEGSSISLTNVGLGPAYNVEGDPAHVYCLANRKPAVSSGFPRADDGTRTHDLLHGKQTL